MKEVSPEKGLQDEDLDPLSDKNVHGVNAITLMRIYDLLGIIATHLDEETATAILEAHEQGQLVGPLPYLNM